MKIEDLQQLVHWLADAGIGSFEIEDDEGSLRIALQPGATAARPATIVVTAEVPGTFLIQHPQSPAPLVSLGAPLRAGELVALVQVGSIYAPVRALSNGRLIKILAVPETLVGYGTPLLEIA